MKATIGNECGFSLSELMISTVVLLILTSASLGTFQSALRVNDSAAQLADANQNLRAGMNQMIRDIMQAGRVIGPEGITVPNGAGAVPIVRPGPPGSALTFTLSSGTNLPDITTGNDLGPQVNGETTDMITVIGIDPFMPVLITPTQGTIASDGSAVTLPANSSWLAGDPVNDTPPIQVGDIVMFKYPNSNVIQTVTRKTATSIVFDAGDYFQLNQRTAAQGSITQQIPVPAPNPPLTVSLFRVVMITYYVDNVTTPGASRLVRKINNLEPQALAGVVEDLQLTYDLVDGVVNPVRQPTLPYTANGQTYTSNQIRTVNIHAGVRSENLTNPSGDYVRNHINTSVDVRSLASVDRYAVN